MNASIDACSFGIMNGVLELILPIESSTRPYFSFSVMVKVLPSTTSMLETKSISFWPMPSRFDQRLIDSTQSSAVTLAPVCHFRPSRSVKVHFRPSSLTLYLSTICGLGVRLESCANSVSYTR